MKARHHIPKEIGKSMIAFFQGHPVVVIPDAPSLEPRYGHGKPPHQTLYGCIDRGRDRYRQLLERLLDYQDDLVSIPRKHAIEAPATDPCWDNRWLPGLDSAVLYGLLAIYRPARYVEIGSGNSTLFARRAVDDHQLSTCITSIDPEPREAIDAICNHVHRVPVQDVELEIFNDLEAGDILFVDSSHRVLTNSDVTVVFMDILPRLKSGVLVHFHDIWLPEDYQPAWSNRFYTEQYMLAMLLLFGNQFEIVLPNHFITNDAELSTVLNPLWHHKVMHGVRTDGASFWIRKT